MSNKRILACHRYIFEELPKALICICSMIEQIPKEQDSFSLYGRLAIDLFTREKLLLPFIEVRNKLIQLRPNFYMLT